HHEQLCADFGRRTMRLGVVGNLVTHPGAKHEASAVPQFGVQFAFQAQEDVALRAPVIRQVARRRLYHAHPEPTENPWSPKTQTFLARMSRLLNLQPVGDSEWDIGHLHGHPSPYSFNDWDRDSEDSPLDPGRLIWHQV